jgi:hypothetical protein
LLFIFTFVFSFFSVKQSTVGFQELFSRNSELIGAGALALA